MIYPIRTIVAGIAELGGDDAVLSPVLDLAGRMDARLHLVHAFELPSLAWDAYGRMGFVDPQVIDEYEASLRERLTRAVAAVAPGIRATLHVIAFPPAAAIVEVAASEGADLIVVGATRRGAVARLLLGTTAQRVLRRAQVPALVIRNELATHWERVLLTTDLSPFSAGVHELGLDVIETLCGDHRPEIRSLLVVDNPIGMPAPLRFDQLRELATTELRRFLDARRDRAGPQPAEQVRFGDAAEEIVAETAEWRPDLVMVGTHSRTTAERWLLGSVAEATVRSVQSNVLVIPAKAEVQRELPVRQTGSTALATPAQPN